MEPEHGPLDNTYVGNMKYVSLSCITAPYIRQNASNQLRPKSSGKKQTSQPAGWLNGQTTNLIKFRYLAKSEFAALHFNACAQKTFRKTPLWVLSVMNQLLTLELFQCLNLLHWGHLITHIPNTKKKHKNNWTPIKNMKLTIGPKKTCPFTGHYSIFCRTVFLIKTMNDEGSNCSYCCFCFFVVFFVVSIETAVSNRSFTTTTGVPILTGTFRKNWAPWIYQCLPRT